MEIIFGILGCCLIVYLYAFVLPFSKYSEEKKAIIKTILITLLVPYVWLIVNGITC